MFRPDKPIGRILTVVFDQMILNFLFLLCSFPVITAGAAAIALYEQEYALWESRDGNLFLDYFRSVKRNFRKGLFLFMAGLLMGMAALGIISSLVLLGLPVKPVTAVVGLLVGGIFFWFLGITGRFEQTMGMNFRNAYTLGIRLLPVTILLGLLNLGYPALFLLMTEKTMNAYLFFLMFFFWGTAAWLTTGLLLLVLAKCRID